jgi:hypothetical protein
VDAVERFAAEATRFRDWALHSTEQEEWAVRGALIRVTQLYLAALELPPASIDESPGQPDAKRVDDSEWRRVLVATVGRLPFDMYGEVFNPFTLPVEEPVSGSLSDDIADIYRDVVTGLQEYEAGRHSEATWEWGFSLRYHWGEHATGAIRALHCWLASNSPDRLSAAMTPA